MLLRHFLGQSEIQGVEGDNFERVGFLHEPVWGTSPWSIDVVLIGTPIESTDWCTWFCITQFIIRESLVIREISKWNVASITGVGQAEPKESLSRDA